MELNVSHWGNGTYRLLTALQPATLAQLEPSFVVPLMKEAGVLLFRGFETNLEQMSAFVERHSVRVTLDPARSFHAKNVQKVDAGFDAIGLHCENAVAPGAPEYVWFYCERAARTGSQTTVCDGARVWEKLSEDTRALFSGHRIKYARTFAPAAWKRWVAVEHPRVKNENDVTEEHLLELVSRFEGQKVQPLGDGRVYTEFCVPAIYKTTSGRWAFANSLLGPSYNYEAPRITTDDDHPIPDAVWADLRKVTEEITEDIDWRDGDVVLIDNTRVMHGRRRIEDPERLLYAALSTAR
jgi:alpha-ketoglutarate-dependent taurine dioxygenase